MNLTDVRPGDVAGRRSGSGTTDGDHLGVVIAVSGTTWLTVEVVNAGVSGTDGAFFVDSLAARLRIDSFDRRNARRAGCLPF